MEECKEVSTINPKRKRGVKNLKLYKNEIIKRSRITGSQYTNSKGNVVPAVTPGVECICKNKCLNSLNDSLKLEVFTKFISFTSKNEQDSYLQSLISVQPVTQRRRRKPEDQSPRPSRGSTYSYELTTSVGKFKVCKSGFIRAHGITAGRVRRLCSLLAHGKNPNDKRGKNVSGNATPGHVINAIKNHIKSFPTKMGHYTSGERYYLSEKLNVKMMFKMFQQQCLEFRDVKYNFYYKIFKEQFSLSFGRPQVDTCCTCEELEVKIKSTFLNDVAKRTAVAEKILHLRRANKFYSTIKSIQEKLQLDETKTTIGGICIDYMQNFQIPCIPVQETFYLRQLTVSVFCIHDLRDNTATFFVYHEGTAGKGPNEVCSFLNQFFETNMKDVQELHIFSDGCGGQNKNHTVIRFLSSLVALKKFKTIEQYFPIRGHSFLPCDRDFAVLKRKIKKTDRIYTVQEYADLILSSSVSKKFTVILPKTADIIDYKSWWPRFYKRNMLSMESIGRHVARENKYTFTISKFSQFSHSDCCDKTVVARDFINGFTSHTFNLGNLQRDELVALPQALAYPAGKVPINIKKMNDIQKLKSYLPGDVNIQEYYDEIFAWPTCEKDCPIDTDQ